MGMLSIPVPTVVGQSVRAAKGRPVANGGRGMNLVKLTRKDDDRGWHRIFTEDSGAVSESPMPRPSSSVASLDVPDSWEEIDNGTSMLPIPAAEGMDVEGDSEWLEDMAKDAVGRERSEDGTPKIAIPGDSLARDSTKVEREEVDEAVVLVSLDRLCGYHVTADAAPLCARQLRLELLGHQCAAPNSLGESREHIPEWSSTLTHPCSSTPGSFEYFVEQTATLFEIGAAVHATVKRGPVFADDLLEEFDIANATHFKQVAANAGDSCNSDTWVAIAYPPETLELRDGCTHNKFLDITAPISARPRSTPPWALYQSPFETMPISHNADGPPIDVDDLRGGDDGRGYDDDDDDDDDDDVCSSTSSSPSSPYRVVGLLRRLLLVCSQPLPWKIAMDEEIVKLGDNVGESMRRRRMQLWRDQRGRRIQQLDEVRSLIVEKQSEFETELDNILRRKEGFNKVRTTMSSRAREADTYSGFSVLEADDGTLAGTNLVPAADICAASPAATLTSGQALDAKEAHTRDMIEVFVTKLDHIDDLYGALLDEEELEEKEEEEREDADRRGGAGEGGAVKEVEDEKVYSREAREDDCGFLKSHESIWVSTTLPMDGSCRGGEDDYLTTNMQAPLLASIAAERRGNGHREQQVLRPAGSRREGVAEVNKSRLAGDIAANHSSKGALFENRTSRDSNEKDKGKLGRLLKAEEEAAARVEADAMPRELRLEVLDSILAMVIGRLPRRPSTPESSHFAMLSAIHAAIKRNW